MASAPALPLVGGGWVMCSCNLMHQPSSPTSTLPSREHPLPLGILTQEGLGVLGRCHRVAATPSQNSGGSGGCCPQHTRTLSCQKSCWRKR